MGTVYEALDREQGVRVALKRLHGRDPASLLKLKLEFRSLRDVQHANLVSLGELVESEGQWFFTMELVEGTDFLSYVRPEEGSHTRGADSPTGSVLYNLAETADRTAVMETHPPLDASALLQLPFTAGQRTPRFHEARLRDTLSQLAEGLGALHEAGKVHRDVKPNNLLVGTDGRLVILDFGLVTDASAAGPGGEGPRPRQVTGTPAYMAPELFESTDITSAADWYSVGVLLFQALVGKLPWNGNGAELIAQKRYFPPPPPSMLINHVPADLDTLCLELLSVDPALRPRRDDLLHRLGRARTAGPRPVLKRPHSRSAPFVGREAELATLERAFLRTRVGEGVTVVVQGESGVGKSAVARRFAERVQQREPDALWLLGRCHERESVPYKAMDGVIDDLSRVLAAMPQEVQAALLPEGVGSLAQLFPVLGQLSSKEEVVTRVLEPRSQLFARLRELFTRLAAARPVVILLDDLQWADADSLLLLQDLLAAPAPALLVLATVRVAPTLAWLPPGGVKALGKNVEHISLQPLPKERARELAMRLLSETGAVQPLEADVIAAGAGGHPLFIQELVYHARSRPGAEAGAAGDTGVPRLKLDDALFARAEGLPEGARRLLELISLSGAPLPNETLRQASGLDTDDYARATQQLEHARFVRSHGLRRADALEPFHDRIRETVVAHLSAADRVRTHERLARALEASASADSEALFIHWEGANDSSRAAVHAQNAAVAAERALAFERAVRLFRHALRLMPEPGAPRLAVQGRLAESLWKAGRLGEGADLYREMAGERKDVEAWHWRRRAAEGYLHAGRVADGRALLVGICADVNLRFPTSRFGALSQLLWWRVRLALRGLEPEKQPRPGSQAELQRTLDLIWNLVNGLGLNDTLLASSFGPQYLLLALESGEPNNLCRGFMTEYTYAAAIAGRETPRSQALLRRGRDIAGRLGDLELGLMCDVLEGASLFVRGGPFTRVLELLLNAEERYVAELPGHSAELQSSRHFGNAALWFVGRWRELQQRVRRQLVEARERGDLFVLSNLLSGSLSTVPLMRGDAETTRAGLDETLSKWPQSPFYVVHFYEILGRLKLHLWEGRPERALAYAELRWKALRGSFLMQLPIVEYLVRSVRAQALLECAARESGRARERFIHLARKDIRKVASLRLPFRDGAERVLSAGLAMLEGRGEDAQTLLEEAARSFEGSDMSLHAAAARFQGGLLLGGVDGAEAARRSLALFKQEGVMAPERMMAILVPQMDPRSRMPPLG